MNKIFKNILKVAAGVLFLAYSVAGAEYMDVPGFDTRIQGGRTKNSISTIVAGIVGRDLYGSSEIELDVKKHFWPDAKLRGHTTEDSIDTKVNLLLTSAEFKAETDASGYLQGYVDKSEFDWKVKQISPHTYEIARWGPKFDAKLIISLDSLSGQDEPGTHGKITGKYIRPGPHFDWGVEGNYDSDGNVEIEVDGPLNLGVTLKGKINKNS